MRPDDWDLMISQDGTSGDDVETCCTLESVSNQEAQEAICFSDWRTVPVFEDNGDIPDQVCYEAVFGVNIARAVEPVCGEDA